MSWDEDEYSAEFLQETRQQLERERDSLVTQNKRNLHEMMDQERVRGDSLDESTQEQGASTELRLRDREKLHMHEIEDALARLAEGVYGECESCGDLIPPKRLKAYPTARLCVTCKEEEERHARHARARPGMLDEMPQGD